MLNVLKARWHQGYRTIPYPRTAPSLPDRFRGVPQVRFSLCPESCGACMADIQPADLRREAMKAQSMARVKPAIAGGRKGGDH